MENKVCGRRDLLHPCAEIFVVSQRCGKPTSSLSAQGKRKIRSPVGDESWLNSRAEKTFNELLKFSS
jgi:hypothetical protein